MSVAPGAVLEFYVIVQAGNTLMWPRALTAVFTTFWITGAFYN